MITTKDVEDAAKRAMKEAYAPYSNLHVGAALYCARLNETSSGAMFTSANVENASYGLTMCAERIALFSAIRAGMAKSAVLLVIATDAKEVCSPCGACLQVFSEHVPDDLLIVSLSNKEGERKEWALKELLPIPFKID